MTRVHRVTVLGLSLLRVREAFPEHSQLLRGVRAVAGVPRRAISPTNGWLYDHGQETPGTLHFPCLCGDNNTTCLTGLRGRLSKVRIVRC